uniref:Uncharacterized protein n=1 Tax=Neobodo designis TaxID=312471 RepID=A0A7S1Q485_NEODS|mmetsp:Transcript_31969/g.99040  ORF Transcript_31969/g.99040 Transcript_31969/m.99040 type:complete len:289 (+) Transcript_31969:44-910(+)|eukprot:CAMPEP_0174844660 /NCGR_PEP_ID=MMETSP1114-20130205/11230_1 /TAXON_ID=312471 /ORGANISM="Neobodo designis, Strain CCAP 1951/1" /LENGTH=288 /DNA_ID=CAMNT_0016078903 /DNA_START=42 /DNA_END=908 /DNA_ORIENTATION=+
MSNEDENTTATEQPQQQQEEARPTSSAEAPRRTGKTSGVAATHALVKELEQQYRAARKDWKHPSPAFSARGERFAKSRKVVDAEYDQEVGSIARERHGFSKKGTWSANAEPQRPPTRELPCKGEYEPKSPQKRGASSKGHSAFASNSPRYEAPKIFAGQDSAGLSHAEPTSAKDKGKGTSPMRSRSPRFQDAPVWTQAQYEQSYGTMAKSLEASKGKGSSWSKSKTAQRPEPRKLVDKVYETNGHGDKRNPTKAAFAGAVPRFPEEKPRAPPVGQYTSPLIAAGMGVE